MHKNAHHKMLKFSIGLIKLGKYFQTIHFSTIYVMLLHSQYMVWIYCSKQQGTSCFEISNIFKQQIFQLPTLCDCILDTWFRGTAVATGEQLF